MQFTALFANQLISFWKTFKTDSENNDDDTNLKFLFKK